MLGWLRTSSCTDPPPSAASQAGADLDPRRRGSPRATASRLAKLYGLQDALRITLDRVIVHAPCTVMPIELLDSSRWHEVVERMQPLSEEVQFWMAVLLNLRRMDPRLGPSG